LRHIVVIRFAIGSDLRFISHHDCMRLFERALSRAQLPVKYSQGFNPRPKISLPVPRTVGVSGEDEILIVGFSRPVDPETVLSLLGDQMPPGINLLNARGLNEGQKFRIDRVEYVVRVPGDQVSRVCRNIRRILEAETWPIQRTGHGKKPDKTVDLRPFLLDASLADDELKWTTSLKETGTIKPAEFLTAAGLDSQALLHCARRTAVYRSHDVDRG